MIFFLIFMLGGLVVTMLTFALLVPPSREITKHAEDELKPPHDISTFLTRTQWCSRGERVTDAIAHNQLHYDCRTCNEKGCCPMVVHFCPLKQVKCICSKCGVRGPLAHGDWCSSCWEECRTEEAAHVTVPSDAKCPVCHAFILDGSALVFCGSCRLAHHEECWKSNEHKCAAYGCGGHTGLQGRYVEKKQIPMPLPPKDVSE